MKKKKERENKGTFSCSHPKVVGNQIFPCGKCINCRKNRINEWANRMQMEMWSSGNKGLFVTLTYKNEYLPSDTTLQKSDLQKFFKRFRKIIKSDSGYYGTFLKDLRLKYFACGEYGKKHSRPHYHIVFFGLPYEKKVIYDIYYAWSYIKYKYYVVGYYKRNVGSHKIGDPIFKKYKYRDYIGEPTKAFDIQALENRHFRYVAKYSVKTFNKSINGVSEFTVMSTRECIGKKYLFDNIDSILNNQLFIEHGKTGFRCPNFVKRYFADQVKSRQIVTYNIVCREPIRPIEFYTYMVLNEKNEVRRQRFFSCNEKYYKFWTPKDLLNLGDRNKQKEIDYCFKRKMSRSKFYHDNRKYFECQQLAKKLVNYRYVDNSTGEIKKEVKGTAFVRRYVDFIDFIKLYSNFGDRILYWVSYGYI